MSKRRIRTRYAQTWLGYGWFVLQPLIFLFAIGFMRAVLFPANWETPRGTIITNEEYLVGLFVGLTLFWFVSENLPRAPSLLREYAGIIKNERIALDSFVAIAMFESVFQLALRFIMLLIGVLIAGVELSLHFLALPLVALPLAMATLGLGWIFARFGTKYRDLEQVLPPLFAALFFVSAVFFPISALPEHVGALLLLNPIAFCIEAARDLVLWQIWPDWYHLSVLTLVGFLLMWLGWMIFDDNKGKYVDLI